MAEPMRSVAWDAGQFSSFAGIVVRMSPASNENEALLTSVLEMSEMHLGAENLDSLAVTLYPAQQRAVVWAELSRNVLAQQLAAVEAFWEVRECYAAELQVELRFGRGEDAELNTSEQSVLSLTR